MDPQKGEEGQQLVEQFRQRVQAEAADAQTLELRAGTGSSTLPHSPTLPPPLPGEVISHYELIRPLGHGGMGDVFLARDTKLGRRVAMKFLNATDDEVGKRFIAEARATALCSHENIVVIYEADQAAGRHYMVLEYLQGKTLSEHLTPGQGLLPARAVELILPVVRALVCAHEQGIVHRDLKPDNVFVTDSGTVKVLDFGIASLLNESAERTDVVLGTLSYMSPEQWGSAPIDHQTDLWSVGVLLFRLLSGQHPLEGAQGAALAVTADLKVPTRSVIEAVGGLPEGLAAVVDRCLKKDKAERFQDARELLKALEPFETGRLNRSLKVGETPYAGLSSFQESDSARFFGRTHEVAAFISRLRSQPLLAVVGSSGAGKSSFVRAGVVPALKRSGERWVSVVVRPSRRPLEVLVDALLQLGDSSRAVSINLQQRDDLLARLRREPGYAGAAFRAHARQTQSNVLLFVDQFEELYTQVPDLAERVLFTTCLSSIADDATAPTRVVLSVRADFIDRVAEDRRFMAELSQSLFLLSAPQREGLAEALVQPAEMAGYHFESNEIVEDMLGHLQTTQGALPLLQFAASKLWDARDPARRLLTMASYRAFGGIAGALAAHADSVVAELPPQSQRMARLILPQLVTPERTRALATIEELHARSADRDGVQQVIDQLVQARLLVVHTTAGGTTVELVHESLITGWPLLRRWLDDGREEQAFREQLRSAARQWDARGRSVGLLWTDEAIEEARLWRGRHDQELPPVEQAFLAAGFAWATRAQRRQRAVVGGIIGVLALMVVFGAVSLKQVRAAEEVAIEQAQVAQREAARAKGAEEKISEQLVQLRHEQEAKAQADAVIAQGKGDLRAANEKLVEALESARTESVNARASAAKANELAGSLKEANQSLSGLLAEERKRAERLEQERKKITTELR